MSDIDRDEVIEKVCAMKAYNSWFSVDVSTVCREKTGGQGLLSVNQLGDFTNVAASLVVVEGDCMLLIQKVAKGLLDKVRREISGGKLLKGASTNLWKLVSLNAEILKDCLYQGSTCLFNVSFLHSLFQCRVHTLQTGLAAKMYNEFRQGKDVLDSWSRNHLVEVQHLGTSFCELFAFEEALKVYQRSRENAEVIHWLLVLYSLYCIEKDLDWFLLYTQLTSSIGSNVTPTINKMCSETRDEEVLELVKGLGLPDKNLRQPIGKNEWLPVN
jgi:acyl-CoA oxidase